jgi:hypothetical protein
VSIEGDAQRDLALNPEDAENVVGGLKKKAAKKAAVHQAVGHAGPNINIQGPVTSTPYVDNSDCDPGDDPAAPATTDSGA